MTTSAPEVQDALYKGPSSSLPKDDQDDLDSLHGLFCGSKTDLDDGALGLMEQGAKPGNGTPCWEETANRLSPDWTHDEQSNSATVNLTLLLFNLSQALQEILLTALFLVVFQMLQTLAQHFVCQAVESTPISQSRVEPTSLRPTLLHWWVSRTCIVPLATTP